MKQLDVTQKIELARKQNGTFKKLTWAKRIGAFRIIYIFLIGAIVGSSYMYIYSNIDLLKSSQPVIIYAVEAKESNEPVAVKIELSGEFTAYNAEVGQTDADPFTMANGKKVFDGAIANNCLDFGTKIEVNGKIYTVSDRMNKRYDCSHFDIFMESHAEAVKFGRQQLNYNIK